MTTQKHQLNRRHNTLKDLAKCSFLYLYYLAAIYGSFYLGKRSSKPEEVKAHQQFYSLDEAEEYRYPNLITIQTKAGKEYYYANANCGTYTNITESIKQEQKRMLGKEEKEHAREKSQLLDRIKELGD